MRLIDADVLMKRHLPNCIGRHDENKSKSFNFFLGYEHAVSGIREVVKTEPTVDAIPMDWLNDKFLDVKNKDKALSCAAWLVLHAWEAEHDNH